MKNDTPMDKLERSLVFVTGDDWEAIYVEGICIKEGHSISILDALMIGAENPTLARVQMEANPDWLTHVEVFPTYIREVRWANEYWHPEQEEV